MAVLFAIVVSYLLLETGCRSSSNYLKDYDKGKTIDTITYHSFFDSSKANSVHSTNLIFKYNITGMEIIDSLLLLSDERDSLTLHIINVNTLEELGRFIKRGEGNNEVINITKIIKTNKSDEFWAYDITQKKLLKYQFRNQNNHSNLFQEKGTFLKDSARNVMSPQWLNDSIFFSSSYGLDNNRFFFFNTNSKIIKKVGVIPPKLGDWPTEGVKNPFKNLAHVYKVNITSNDKNRIVVAYLYMPQIEIYNKNKLIKIIRGPSLFLPKPAFTDDKMGGAMVSDDSKTIYAYVWLCGSKNYFYSLFSQKNEFNSRSDEILIFNWNGDPIRRIKLKYQINCFAVQEINNRLKFFFINPNTRGLEYFIE